MVKHVSKGLAEALHSMAPVVVSPTAWLCEGSEDFVGRVARITRRVHARTCGERAAHLCKVFLEWQSLGKVYCSIEDTSIPQIIYNLNSQTQRRVQGRVRVRPPKSWFLCSQLDIYVGSGFRA